MLRARVAEVKNWYDLGTQVMKEARNERGLSYEAMGRLLNTSGKTYERWEKRGQVPRAPAGTIEAVAEILGLEIEHETLPRRHVTVPQYRNGSVPVSVQEALEGVRAAVARLDDLLEEQPRERPGKASERSEN